MKTTNKNETNKLTKKISKFLIYIILNSFLILYFNLIALAQNPEQFEQNNTVFSTNDENTTSPLFYGFETIALEGNVYLKWYIKDKENSKNYIIERSNDGVSFMVKGSLQASGGNLEIIILNCFTDQHPINGYSFYRIVAIDNFGNVNYSNVNTVYNDYQGSITSNIQLVDK